MRIKAKWKNWNTKWRLKQIENDKNDALFNIKSSPLELEVIWLQDDATSGQQVSRSFTLFVPKPGSLFTRDLDNRMRDEARKDGNGRKRHQV